MDIFFAAIVVGIIVFIAAVVIGGWLLTTAFRGVFGFLFGSPKPSPRPDRNPHQRSVVQCDRPQCLAHNPGHARFCRRCGGELKAQVRRVA